jgi:SAM-dependent methyltransferase
MRLRGVAVHFLVFDLLPLQFPRYFPDYVEPACRDWLKGVSGVADGLICISRTVADQLGAWLERHPPDRQSALRIGYFHLGADIESSHPTSGLPPEGAQTLEALRGRPSFLMVGTVEPRKGHAQALSAFEGLWANGLDANLVIVGKEGWLVEKLARRLRAHREYGKRLFWLHDISDEYLLEVYRASAALLAASEGEGFGLPLIEAARNGLPIIARDIPVFREVAGSNAYYFSADQPEDLGRAVREWLVLHSQGKAPDVSAIRFLAWEEAAGQLLSALVGGAWYRGWAPPAVKQWALDNHLMLIHRARLLLVRTLLPAGEMILDLGGANAPLHRMGYPHRFRRLTMIDLPAEDRHEYYREIVVDQTSDKGQVVVHYGDMTSLGAFEDESVDLVWSGQSIEHVPEEAGARMCREAWRVLKKGGVFCLDTPNRLLTEIHTKPCGGGFIHPEHCIEYRPDQLRQILVDAGFVVDASLGVCEMPETAATGEFHYEDFILGRQISENIEGSYIQFYKCIKPAIHP